MDFFDITFFKQNVVPDHNNFCPKKIEIKNDTQLLLVYIFIL